MLQKKNKKINEKLNKIGKILDMDILDVAKSKKTLRSVAYVFIATAIISFVGLFIITRIDSVGLWYAPTSIQDFNFFKGFF